MSARHADGLLAASAASKPAAPAITVTGPAKPRSFIRHLHTFRGFAIISVVLTHAFKHQIWDAGGPSVGDPALLFSFSQSLFYNSTIYFTLISGLVFSVALQKRGWPAFFKSKFKFVILPYLLISLAWFAMLWSTLSASEQAEYLADGPLGVLSTMGQMLVVGGASYQLWYVPVVAVLFLMTPLLVAILDNPRLRWAAWLIMLAPLVISRDFTQPTWTNVVYFTGVYLVGVLIGRHYDVAREMFRRWLPALWAIVGVLTVLEVVLHLTGIDRVGMTSVRESVFYVLRLAVSALVLHLMATHEHRMPKWLDTLATYAFTVYFLHVAILMVFDRFVDGQLPQEALTLPLMIGLGLVAAFVALTVPVAIGVVAKRFFGERSRYVLGS